MTEEQLDAIRARVEAATPGPWEAWTAVCCPDCGWVDGPQRTVCPVYEGTKPTHTLDANDAEFIASAREDVPALLAEVERLTEICAAQNATMLDALCAETDAKVKVERLTAERDAAFRRGVNAAADELDRRLTERKATAIWVGPDELRALPDPEDTHNQQETK